MDGCFGCMLDVSPYNSKYKLGVSVNMCKLCFPVLHMTFYSFLEQLTALQVLNVVGFLWTSDPEIDRSCTQQDSAWRMPYGKHMLSHFEPGFSGGESCVCLRIFYDFVMSSDPSILHDRKICQVDPTQSNNNRRICQEGGDADTTETENHTSVFAFCPRNKGACGLSLVWFSYFARALATDKRDVIVIVMLDPDSCTPLGDC